MGAGSEDERTERLLREFRLGDEDRAAWEASGLGAGGFDDWLTDRLARRPAGARARTTYGAESVHDFARAAILDALALTASDHLLEIGCGGGLLLRDALGSGAAATGLDHSAEMVEVARRTLSGVPAKRSLRSFVGQAPRAALVIADAGRLPLADGAFTAVAMSVVFFFFPQPLRVLRECGRVLAAGGRMAVYTTGPELRGTPAAPEPIASRGHFYEDAALARLAADAGFEGAHVVNRDGGQLLTAQRARLSAQR